MMLQREIRDHRSKHGFRRVTEDVNLWNVVDAAPFTQGLKARTDARRRRAEQAETHGVYFRPSV